MSKKIQMLIISDTHVYNKVKLPKKLIHYLHRVNYIVHVGDISHPSVLEEFRKFAPVFSVLGNKTDDITFFSEKLKKKTFLNINGVRFLVTHGAGEIDYKFEQYLGKEKENLSRFKSLLFYYKKIIKKFGYRRLLNYIISFKLYKKYRHDADCIIFGHTHIPYHRNIGDLKFINPGDAQYSRKEYINFDIVTVKNKKIKCKSYRISIFNKRND